MSCPQAKSKLGNQIFSKLSFFIFFFPTYGLCQAAQKYKLLYKILQAKLRFNRGIYLLWHHEAVMIIKKILILFTNFRRKKKMLVMNC